MRKIMLFFALALMYICSMALLAFGADAAPAAVNTVGNALTGLLHGDVWPILGSLLTALIGIVLNKVRVKTGLQISAERQKQLNDLALRGIAIAEEKAAALIKAKATTVTGQNKLDMAIAYIIGMAPAVTSDQADALVHAALAKTIGVGATASKTV